MYLKEKFRDNRMGVYVVLNDSGCEGLIKLSSMTDDHYVYNSKEFCLTGYSS